MRPARGSVTDRLAILAAVAVGLGAWRPHDVHVGVVLGIAAGVLVLAAVVVRGGTVRGRGTTMTIGLVLVGVGLVVGFASLRSRQAWAAVAPTAAGPVAGDLVARTDPAERAGIIVLDAEEVGGADRRLAIVVSGPRRAEAAELQAGDRFRAVGRVEPRRSGADHEARRHVVGTLTVDTLTGSAFATGLAGAANRVRRLVGVGSASLAPEERALLAGFVLGDDRGQGPEQADAFRAAGLGHLLVVSGQNVAFVLLLARPLLARMGPRRQVVATAALLWSFGVLTRFEPSVMRATLMAALTAVALATGRAAGARRTLAATVVVLVLLDPLIAGSIGFVLSVVATAGILLWAAPISARLRGPRAVRDASGVTVAAQAAVAPVLAAIGGGATLSSVPSNLAVAPVAGPLMGWGLVVGPLTGVLQEHGVEGAASVLHAPTRLGVLWIQSVAAVAASADLPEVPLLLVVVAVAAVAVAGRLTSSWARRSLVLAALLPLAALGLRPLPAPEDGCTPPPRLAVWCTVDRAGPVQVVLIDGRSGVDAVLRSRREVPLRRVVVVLASSAPGAQPPLAALARRVDVVAVWRPVGAPEPGVPGGVVSEPSVHRVGALVVRLTPAEGRLRVVVEPA